MAILKNQRHELFAQGIASGKSATQAAIDAHFSAKTAYSAGGRLLKKVDIKTRISELQHKVETRSIIDRARVLKRLDTLSRKAEKAKQLTAAIRAEELLGRAVGLFDSPGDEAAPKPSTIKYRWAEPGERAPESKSSAVAESAEITPEVQVQ